MLLVVKFGSQEKRSNQLKCLQQTKKREVQTPQQKLITTFIDFLNNIAWPYQPSSGLQNQMVC